MPPPTATTRSPQRPWASSGSTSARTPTSSSPSTGPAPTWSGLQSLLRPFEAVICAESAHINVDECGAPERFLGSKLIAVATPDGKLTPELVDGRGRGVGDEHHVQPKVVSITQSTEVGTVLLGRRGPGPGRVGPRTGHVAPPRRGPAVQRRRRLGSGPRRLRPTAGVDVLSYGGTKNGAMGAEAVVSFLPANADALRFIRKQSMQLASKMRFVAAQFVALLSDDLWLRNARTPTPWPGGSPTGCPKSPG